MADDAIITDKPLDHIDHVERGLDPAPKDAPGIDRLRAFEDKHFGKDAVRINGRIERGSGSPYATAKPEVRRQYEMLEALIEADQRVADARAALAVAEEAHDRALAALENEPDIDTDADADPRK